MKKRDKLIVFLLIFGVLAFCAVEWIIVPRNEAKLAAYNEAQNDALSHDIESVLDYKRDYLGDNSNTANLFYHLPLNSVSMQFEIDSENLGLTVAYLDTVENIGAAKVHRDLIYNATAAMALIANLKQITFTFSDATFIFTREEVESSFGSDLAALLDRETWQESVQNKLQDVDFVNGFYPQS